MEHKRSGTDYQNGEVAFMAVKRKATISAFDPCTAQYALDIFQLLLAELLLKIAHTCNIDVGTLITLGAIGCP